MFPCTEISGDSIAFYELGDGKLKSFSSNYSPLWAVILKGHSQGKNTSPL